MNGWRKYVHNGISLSHKKEQKNVCSHPNEPWMWKILAPKATPKVMHYEIPLTLDVKDASTEGHAKSHALYDSPHNRCPEWANPEKRKWAGDCQVLAEGRSTCWLLMSSRFFWPVVKKSRNYILVVDCCAALRICLKDWIVSFNIGAFMVCKLLFNLKRNSRTSLVLIVRMWKRQYPKHVTM